MFKHLMDCSLLSPHNQTGNGSATVPEESDYSEDTDSPKTNHKPFFRRLSFKGLRKGKVIHVSIPVDTFDLPS